MGKLFQAMESGTIDLIKLQLQTLRNNDKETLEKKLLKKQKGSGRTLLHIAVLRAAKEKNFLEIIQELLTLGIDMLRQDNDRKTALELAQDLNCNEVVILLRIRQFWQSKYPNVNFNRVLNLIKASYFAIEPGKNKNLIMMIGSTDAGKSTFINYLMGCKYELAKKDGGRGKKYAKCIRGIEVARTGHSSISTTLYPQVISKEGLSFSYGDLAGLYDTRGEEERICAANSTHLLSCLAKKIKAIVLVIDFEGFRVAKGKTFREAAVTLSRIFKNDYELLASSVYFVITRAEKDVTPEGIVDEYIDSMLYDEGGLSRRDKNSLTEEESALKDVLEAMQEPFLYNLYILPDKNNINVTKIDNKAIVLVGTGETKTVYFVENNKFVMSTQGKLKLDSFKLPIGYKEKEFKVNNDGKVEKPSEKPKREKFDNLLHIIREQAGYKIKHRIIIPDIFDDGQSRESIEKIFESSEPLEKDDVSFTSHDGAQEKFNAILLDIFEYFLAKGKKLATLPNDINGIQDEYISEEKYIKQWNEEIKVKEDQKKTSNFDQIREQNRKQVLDSEHQILENTKIIWDKEKELKSLHENKEKTEKNIAEINTDKLVEVKRDTFTRPAEYVTVAGTSRQERVPIRGRKGKITGYQNNTITTPSTTTPASGTGLHEFDYRLDYPIREFKLEPIGGSFKGSSLANGRFKATFEYSRGVGSSATVVLYTTEKSTPENRAKIARYNSVIITINNKIQEENAIVDSLKENIRKLRIEIEDCREEITAAKTDIAVRNDRLDREIKERKEKLIPNAQNKLADLQRRKKEYEKELAEIYIELELNIDLLITIKEMMQALRIAAELDVSIIDKLVESNKIKAGQSKGLYGTQKAGSSFFKPSPNRTGIPTNFSTFSTPSILNVSGHGNNCGLFALVLGIQMASRHQKIPLPKEFAYLTDLRSEALRQYCAETPHIGPLLREALSKALTQDNNFKRKRSLTFISCASDYFEKQDFSKLERDMEAFFEPKENKEVLNKILSIWLNVLPNLQSYHIEDFLPGIEQQKLSNNEISSFYQLIGKLIVDIDEQNGQSRINQLFKVDNPSKITSLVDLIRLRMLYRVANARDALQQSSQPSEMRLFDEFVTRFFTEAYQHQIMREGEIDYKRLYIFAVLEGITFDQDCKISKVAKREDILTTARSLFAERLIAPKWQQIYQSYCNYIKEGGVELNFDELGILARQWNIQLTVLCENGEQYKSFEMYNSSLLQVTLCNPSLHHWQVYLNAQQVRNSEEVSLLAELFIKGEWSSKEKNLNNKDYFLVNYKINEKGIIIDIAVAVASAFQAKNSQVEQRKNIYEKLRDQFKKLNIDLDEPLNNEYRSIILSFDNFAKLKNNSHPFLSRALEFVDTLILLTGAENDQYNYLIKGILEGKNSYYRLRNDEKDENTLHIYVNNDNDYFSNNVVREALRKALEGNLPLGENGTWGDYVFIDGKRYHSIRVKKIDLANYLLRLNQILPNTQQDSNLEPRVKHPKPLLESHDLQVEEYQTKVKAVAMLVFKKNVKFQDNKYTIFAEHTLNEYVKINYGGGLPLRQDQPYREQGMYGFGTAFLAGADVIITAGHCLGNNDVNLGSYVVFNFNALKEKMKDGQRYAEFDKEDVYTMNTIIDKKFDPTFYGSDWAVVKLDRAVPKTIKIPKRSIKKPDDRTPLYIMGHPFGLPVKIDMGGRINNNKPQYKFFANLSIFGGNSGSPVFNSRTNEVEGILVASDTRQPAKDFERDRNSNSMIFSVGADFNADTEHCTRISEVEAAVNKALKP